MAIFKKKSKDLFIPTSPEVLSELRTKAVLATHAIAGLLSFTEKERSMSHVVKRLFPGMMGAIARMDVKGALDVALADHEIGPIVKECADILKGVIG